MTYPSGNIVEPTKPDFASTAYRKGNMNGKLYVPTRNTAMDNYGRRLGQIT
jgi:hypothetical protein